MELDDDDRFQRRQWAVQRAAWAILALVPLAAVAGLFGGGAVGQRESHVGGASVGYDRFIRRETETSLQLRVPRGALPRDTVHIRISSAYAAEMNPISILPAPLRMTLDESWLHLWFAPPERGEAIIRIALRPSAFGQVTGVVAVRDSVAPPLRHFVWP